MKQPPFAYCAYGLRITSDQPLPGLVPLNSSSLSLNSPDLQIRHSGLGSAQEECDLAGEALWYTSDIRDANGDPALKIWKGKSGGNYFIRYTHGLTFSVNSAISRLHVHCVQPLSDGDIAPFLLGPALGIVLRLRGVTCLHASAVNIRGRAIAFVGAPGAGKSTIAAVFARKGHSVLTDDIVAIGKRDAVFIAHPGYPFLNLLPDSIALLSGRVATSGPLPNPVEKIQVRVDERDDGFQEEALPLAAIYFLAKRSDAASATFVSPISSHEALIALASNSYANRMLDAEMRVREFRTLGDLARSTPVRRLTAPARLPDVNGFYRTICEDAVEAVGLRRHGVQP